jgi:hypothetical protein
MYRQTLSWLLVVVACIAAVVPAAAQGKKREELGPSVWLEVVGNQKRILVAAEVCLREVGQIGLECLLCGKNKKEYESIMATEADAKVIFDGLKQIGAAPGAPCKYELFEAPAGPAIKVKLRYDQGGKTTLVDTPWEAPADTILRLTYSATRDGKAVEVPPSWDVPAGVAVTAVLSYVKDGETTEYKPVTFEVPAGAPVKLGAQFQQAGKTTVVPPPYIAATGTPVKLTLQYEMKGKLVTVPWTQWVRDGNTKKNPEADFVFAGSLFFNNPLAPNGPPRFAASDEGAIVCVCDVPTALLALPYWSPKGQNDRFYEPNTPAIPPVGTKVMLILEPVLKK